ncbi:hypothetical protein [Rhizobacter sp. Root404]|uniref:hypothetical protein n=1 Tax=Rhizobacter sp. Root404 TaxID=1736528 RepID=UPI000A96FB22|nr:hypothetical protein [Rhizobacter sp. Root404]
MKRIYATIGNEYGTPFVYDEDGLFVFMLEGAIEDRATEVSKEFYDAFVKEFGHDKRNQ